MIMRRLTLLLVGLLMLLACSLSSTVPATPTRAPLLPTAESTAKPTRPPVGVQTLPTVTPIADEPLATLESTPLPPALDGLFDDFGDPGSGWDINSGKEGSVGYENGEYVIQVDEVDYSLWANPGAMFDDVVVGVTMQLAADSEPADMGAICRYDDASNFMYGTITSDGFYGITQMKDGDFTILTGAGKLQANDTIRQGDKSNQMQFLCAGNNFALFVNDQFIDAVQADAPAGGDVGLLAGTFDTGGARVRFDDFSAVLPPPGTEIGPVGDTALFADDFSDPDSGWDVRETENGGTGYVDGRYFIRIDTPKFQLWSSPGQSFDDDVIVEAIAGLASGPEENEMGVFCRYQDRQNFMYASIGTDGYYAIVEIKDDEATILTGDGQFQRSDVIPIGSEAYYLQLACVDDQYTLLVNGEEIDSAASDAFTGGDVGLLAGTFEQGGVEVLFDDFRVIAP
jgi:hypothetical protein